MWRLVMQCRCKCVEVWSRLKDTDCMLRFVCCLLKVEAIWSLWFLCNHQLKKWQWYLSSSQLPRTLGLVLYCMFHDLKMWETEWKKLPYGWCKKRMFSNFRLKGGGSLKSWTFSTFLSSSCVLDLFNFFKLFMCVK